MIICLEWGAGLHMSQLMPLPLTVSCFSKIQIGFTFLVLAHLGSPGKRAVKRVCVRVFVHNMCYMHADNLGKMHTPQTFTVLWNPHLHSGWNVAWKNRVHAKFHPVSTMCHPYWATKTSNMSNVNSNICTAHILPGLPAAEINFKGNSKVIRKYQIKNHEWLVYIITMSKWVS